MRSITKMIIGLCLIAAMMPATGNIKTMAATKEQESKATYDMICKSIYMAKISKSGVEVRDGAGEESEKIATLSKNSSWKVMDNNGGWIQIDMGEAGTGYVQVADGVFVYETMQTDVDEQAKLRADVVNYALSFVGGRYVYGGTNPNSGVDCSGFTRYVMSQVAGVGLTHSSRAQASEGQTVSLSSLEPGDLVFYSSGGGINHVAIYIGDGQIVHASSAKTGIKVSDLYNSRTPVKAVRVL